MTIERPTFPRPVQTPRDPFRTAFFDIEPKIHDLDRAGQIAFHLAQQVSGVDELLLFAVGQFHDMAASLRKLYQDKFAAAQASE